MRGRPVGSDPPTAADPHDPQTDAAGGRSSDRGVGDRRPRRRGCRRGGAGPRLPARRVRGVARRHLRRGPPALRRSQSRWTSTGAIRFAATWAGIEERFVVNGDARPDVAGLVAFHDDHGAEGTIALHQVDDPSFGVVPTAPDGRVLAFVEKPPPGEAPTDLINAAPTCSSRRCSSGSPATAGCPSSARPSRRWWTTPACTHSTTVACTGPTPARRCSTCR